VRIVRQLVTESTVLALAGSSAGLLLAWWSLTYLAKTTLAGSDVAPDLGTFGYVLAMAFATGILFGLSPALHATRAGVAHELRESGTGTRRRSRQRAAGSGNASIENDVRESRRRAAHRGSAAGGDFDNNQNTRVGAAVANSVIRAAMAGRLTFKDAYDFTGLRGGAFQEYARRLGMNLP
jgi:hypothetical protein